VLSFAIFIYLYKKRGEPSGEISLSNLFNFYSERKNDSDKEKKKEREGKLHHVSQLS